MDDWKKRWNESGYYFSDDDWKYAENDEVFRDKIYRAKELYANGDTEGGHALAEEARRAYNYSGGEHGDEYLPWGNEYQTVQTPAAPVSNRPTWDANGAVSAALNAATQVVQEYAPYNGHYTQEIDDAISNLQNYDPYTSPYDDRINAVLDQLENYGPYTSPYADQISAALANIEGYGPYVSPYADRLGALLSDIEGYGPYQSQYADQIEQQLAAIQNRDPFSYDLESDPAWHAYKQQYTREGNRAMEDAMGQYAAMTGGMPSTAAMTAAQQAGNYYNAQMTDKIPELYKLAYDMYNTEGNRMLSNLNTLRGMDSDAYGRWGDTYDRMLTDMGMLQGLDQTDYGRWADQYNQYLQNLGVLQGMDQTDYNRWGDTYNQYLQNLGVLQGMDQSEYGRWSDQYDRMLTDLNAARTIDNDAYDRYRDAVRDWENDRDFAYGVSRDQVSDARYNQQYGDSRSDYAREYADSRSDLAYDRAYDLAWDAYKAGDDSFIRALGINPATSGGGRSVGGNSGGNKKPSLTYTQVKEAIRNGRVNQYVRDAYEYYVGEPYQEGSENSPYGNVYRQSDETKQADITPMTNQSYGVAGRGIVELLQSGREKEAENQAATIWPYLTNEQRDNLRNTLKQFGINIEED